MSENKFDYVVVGAGFAGAPMAERLSSQGSSVLVIEQKDHVGGNCYDYIDENGITIHKYGPHIFHTKSKEVWDYLSRFTEWLPYKHKVIANIEGKTISLPVSLMTLHQLFDKEFADKIEKKLISEYGKDKSVSVKVLLNSKDPEIKSSAEIIFRKVFLNYSKKQWGMDPLDLDPEVLNRVPIWTNNNVHYFQDAYQGIPKNGYTAIIEKMLKKPNITVMLNKAYKDVKDKLDYKKLFFTGPIDDFFDFKYGALPYRAIKFAFETLDYEWFQTNSVVNYPGKESFTRITEYKHFNNHKSKKTAILREYPEDYSKGKNVPSYPIPKQENRAIYGKYKAEADTLDNVVFLGRLAEYKYYNMDEVVGRALRINKEAL